MMDNALEPPYTFPQKRTEAGSHDTAADLEKKTNRS